MNRGMAFSCDPRVATGSGACMVQAAAVIVLRRAAQAKHSTSRWVSEICHGQLSVRSTFARHSLITVPNTPKFTGFST